MIMRTIKRITKAEKVNMGGIFIDQPLPNMTTNQVDPFLLIHHWASILQGGQSQKEVGVGPHPHRGFSPVTIIFKGALHHRDSLGNDSVIKAGGVQWMHAGKGITHSERPSKALAEKGGEFEIIQFWINTPSGSKMNPAVYYPKTKDELPVINFDEGKARLQVLTGQYDNVEGPIPQMSPLFVARLDMDADATINLDLEQDHHVVIYQLDGDVTINENQTGPKSMVIFENEGGDIKIASHVASRLLILTGKPIGEPVESYGPFVMNNTTEIMQAMRDAQIGKMGVLIEEFE
ncbi:MAG: pirin family protein [Saprospiraceae bacterium]|nr:pirin family protein [Bacteroidia bacterium]NNE14393.1 pirin family protein [Saprospiraceae bacterium]NNL92071.1 pirin family protein [Saprospiraceae bacterium]